MFGSLKKRLKEAVEKVSKSISGEETKEQPKEEHEEIKEEAPEHPIEKEAEKPVQETLRAQAKEKPSEEDQDEELLFGPEDKEDEDDGKKKETLLETDLETQLDRKIDELEDLKEKIQEEKLPADIAESKLETKEITKEEKSKQGFSFLRRITEKKLSDSEIEKILKELHIALLENDVAVEVAERISSDVKQQLTGASVKRGKVEDTIKDALRHAMLGVMNQDKINLEEKISQKDGPFVIMMVGFNGTGKTTTLAKLAFKLKKYNPVLAAADTFRAASIEQLEEHGKRVDMRVIKHTYGADAAAVIFDAKKHAAASGSKLVLADTAGRSHSNVNLMDELKKVARVNNPDMKILVLDSVTGNDIYDQCRLFNDAVGIDAIILTKADVYERGGAALSAAYTLKKPILYIGVGQNYEDLKDFNPEEIVNNLLG